MRHTPAGAIYRLSLALLDLDDPRRIIRRGQEWVFGPLEGYELTGDVANVVFPCGTVLDEATNLLRVYYGAADSCIALATAEIADLLDWLKAQPGELAPRRRAGDFGPLGVATDF